MAWPRNTLTTYQAKKPPPIKAQDLNLMQQGIVDLTLGNQSVQSLTVDRVGGTPVLPTPGMISAEVGMFTREVSASFFQTQLSQGSSTLPCPKVPPGQLHGGNLLLGTAFLQMLPPPGILMYFGTNVGSVSHPKVGESLVTFQVDCSHALPMVVSHGNSIFVLSQAYVVSLRPLTVKIIQAYPNSLTRADQDVVLYVVGE